MLDEQAGRPKQLTHAEFRRLVDRGCIDQIERAVWRGELDDVRATLQAARAARFEAMAAEMVDTEPGRLDR